MNENVQLFSDIGEPFAAGFYEEPDASNAKRFCRAYRRYYENCPVDVYHSEGATLYPSCNANYKEYSIQPQYNYQFLVDWDALNAKSTEAAEVFTEFTKAHFDLKFVEGYDDVMKYCADVDAWSHSDLNYKRITAEGLDGYEQRIRKMKDADLREALLDVIAGIRCLNERVVAYLETAHADEKLIDALKKVPFSPAETAYEAMVSVNFMLWLDGYDDIGYADSWLPNYWKGEDLTTEMHAMMKNLQDCEGWTVAIGPEYSDLTKQWIRASKGLARPMVELRTTEDMPDDIWEVALERIMAGGGQPAFYNEKAIQRRLAERIPDAPKEDLYQFSGMGCTETCLSGLTYCGGIDVNLDVAKVLDDTMREDMASCDSFESFYETFFKRVHQAQDNVINYVNNFYMSRAENSFAPIRTIFTDDCIAKEKGFLQGGARYTYSIPSDSGIPNTTDSLLAIKELIYEKKLYSARDFIKKLDEQDPRFLSQLRQCPAYGTGNEQADEMINKITKRFYSYYRGAKHAIGLGFLPTSHQFVRHVSEGASIGYTPDGRKAGQPLADSIAAVNGKAVKGPTLMLISAAKYEQEEVYGIPVLNLSITRKFNPKVLRSLVEGYFEMNGTQVQVTCVNKDTLLKAKENPDDYRDLVVRVGGYSEYFWKLSPGLQNAVVERTMFES